jgi:NAD(P)-dependent dehydrogenase (short-subunit alcohol dehydrogenase family)
MTSLPQQPTALVIGASAGIGRAATERLAELGYRIAAVGRRPDRLAEIAAITGATTIEADVSVPDDCERLVAEAVDALGVIDLIVHAASASGLAVLADTDAVYWHRVLHTNVVAPSLVLRAVLPHLSKRSVACLLSSEIVGHPYLGLTPYAVSKAALEESIRGWREEHPDLRLCCLRVGATSGTDFARDFAPEVAEQLLPTWIAQGRIPDTFMEAAELGHAIADTLDLAIRRPGLDVQDLVIRAPGGAHRGSTDHLVAEVEAQNSRR